jgi:hypothetical protein
MMSKKRNKVVGKILENPWILSTFILASLVIVMTFVGLGVSAERVSVEKVGENFVEFVGSQGVDVEIVDAKEFESGLYELIVSVKAPTGESQELPVYTTSDGKYFMQGIVPLTDNVVEESAPQKQEPVQNVVKSDKPLVQLFVMTHCPFGTQAEKGFLPAMKALGNAADFEVRFVHYFMHTKNQEEVETPRQVCIREEQSDKFIPYLECFLGKTGTQEDAAACDSEVGIDTDALAECIESGRAEEYYAEDSVLSEAAGVRGSPTLVVNGAMVQSGRSAQAYGDVVCKAFNEVPELCGIVELDAVNPSPGFGYGGASSGSTASCG